MFLDTAKPCIRPKPSLSGAGTTNNDMKNLLSEAITIDKITRAIDLLIPELFIVSKDIVSPLLCNLFNYSFDNCMDSWCYCFGPQKEKSDVNNYRAITLTSLFSIFR